MSALKGSRAGQCLAREASAAPGRSIRELFAADPQRVERLASMACGITVDASRTAITEPARQALFELAREADVDAWRARMWAGEPINISERRAALHPALRLPELAAVSAGGVPIGERIAATSQALQALVEAVRSGAARTAAGGTFRDVVNIGIGGSDLGPRLACAALDGGTGPLRVHFVANIDPVALDRVCAHIDPARTLFIVASKTFTTRETLANAHRACALLEAAVGADGVRSHLVAVTGARARAAAFGVDPERILDLPDWVGGRYSVWSAVGLPLALACGNAVFAEFLAGGAAMDRHFRDAPIERNLPYRLALVGIWHRNFLGLGSHVVVPYGERLALLPDYLQQLELESNGKSVDRDGVALDHATTPALWGAVGTNAQHAFFQWLHQGSEPVSCDLLAVRGSGRRTEDELAANCLAQGAALLDGVGPGELAAVGCPPAECGHRRLPGNRPSTTLLLDDLSPRTLGALLALYEHKVFCQAMLWRINPFDQWGVERGKQLAGRLDTLLTGAGGDTTGLDPSTRALVERYHG